MTESPTDRLNLVDFAPDTKRAADPWRQVWRDLVASAPVSHWATGVTRARIEHYDQIRPPLTRGALLAAIWVVAAFADSISPWTVVLLSIGVVQTFLEIYLDFQLNNGEPRWALVRRMTRVLLDWQWEQTLINVTGVIGAVAVVSNLVAVLFLIGPNEPGWVKVAALLAAVAYGNSGVLAVLTDVTYFSVHQRIPRVVVLGRAHVWLLAGLVLAVLVAVSIASGRWSQADVPYAWLCCGLVYMIGLKTRDYDRLLRASSQQALHHMTEARKRLAQDFHDDITTWRTFNRLSRDEEGVSPTHRLQLVELASRATLAAIEMADETRWIAQGKQLSVTGRVEWLAKDLSVPIEHDIALGELSNSNLETVRQVLTTVLINAAQAMASTNVKDQPIKVRARVADDRIVLAVSDPLPLASDDRWCRKGSTTYTMRERVRALRGDLTQVERPPGKEIRAEWPVKPPRLARGTVR